jgi:hypothetical protein
MALTAKVYHVDGFMDAQVGGAQCKVVTKDSISTSQNDYAILTSADETIAELRASAALNITGIVAPSAAKVLILYNRSAYTITLKDASASSAAANRILGISGDFALVAGAFVPLFYDTVQSRWIVSTVVNRSGFKIDVDSTDGAVVMLDARFWSALNTALSAAEAARTEAVFYRYGLLVPTASYASDTAAKRASLPIQTNGDEVLHQPRGTLATFLLADANDVVMSFRSNEAGLGLAR